MNKADTKNIDKKQLMIIIALLMVYIFWGGTYLGIRIAIETIPPFLTAGVRFIIAGLILYTWARMSGVERPRLHHWKETGIVGALMLLVGNGIVTWAEQTVDSGIAALLVATVPLWIIVLNWFNKNEKKPGIGVISGVLLGMVGIAVLVIQPGSTTGLDKGQFIGMIALVFASLSWSAGSLYSRSGKLPEAPILSTAMQMLTGGGLLLIVSLITGEWGRADIAHISLRSYIGLGYLIVFGSIMAFNAYIWLLKNAEPSLVSTYAFVNPVVAVLLGWAMAGERLTMNSLIAAVIIVTAVGIITVFRGGGKK